MDQILTNISAVSSVTSDFAPRRLNKTASTSFSLPTLAYKKISSWFILVLYYPKDIQKKQTQKIYFGSKNNNLTIENIIVNANISKNQMLTSHLGDSGMKKRRGITIREGIDPVRYKT